MAALVALLLCAAPAHAEQTRNLAGVWGFETAPESSDNCIIRGRAHLTVTRTANAYDVRMQVTQHCDTGDDIQTEQTCTATRTDQDIIVDCRLVTEPNTPYLPDNFTLEIRNGALMEGSLVSGWIAPAVWRRDGEAFVS